MMDYEAMIEANMRAAALRQSAMKKAPAPPTTRSKYLKLLAALGATGAVAGGLYAARNTRPVKAAVQGTRNLVKRVVPERMVNVNTFKVSSNAKPMNVVLPSGQPAVAVKARFTNKLVPMSKVLAGGAVLGGGALAAKSMMGTRFPRARTNINLPSEPPALPLGFTPAPPPVNSINPRYSSRSSGASRLNTIQEYEKPVVHSTLKVNPNGSVGLNLMSQNSYETKKRRENLVKKSRNLAGNSYPKFERLSDGLNAALALKLKN
jgi:hypothetical protein